MNREKRKESYTKLDKLLKAKGITAYRLSDELKLPRSLFSDWKSGKSMPKTDKLLKIADYFGVAVSYFVE